MKRKLFGMFLFVLSMLAIPGFASAATVDVTDETSLKSALTNVSGETVVNVMNDIEVTAKVQVTGAGKVTINGNGNKVFAGTNVTDRIFELRAEDGEEKLLDVTFSNIVIENDFNNGSKGGRGVDTRTDNIKLTLDSVTINCKNLHNNQPITIGGSDTGVTTVVVKNSELNAGVAGYAIISFVKADITIENSTLEGYAALYMQSGTEGTVINVKDSTLISKNTSDDLSNRFATVAFNDDNITLNIVDSTVEAIGTGETYQSAFFNSSSLEESAGSNKIIVSGDKSVIKVNNAATVPEITDSETGEVLDVTNEYAYNNEKLDITFGVGVTTDVVVADEVVETIPTDYLPADAVVEENEDGTLVVVVKHSVTINSTTNGKVIADKLEALVGDVIKLNITPNTDYVVDTIVVTNLTTNEKVVVDAKNGTFVMPDSEVSVEVTFRANANPDTSDNVAIYFVMGIVSVIGLGFATLKLRKEM